MLVEEFLKINKKELEDLLTTIRKNFNNYTQHNRSVKSNNLIEKVNKVILFGSTIEKTGKEQEAFQNLWNKLYPNLNKAFVRLQLPIILTETILTETLPTQTIVPMEASEYFKLAENILPREFDGSPEKLQTFLDALTLLSANTTATLQDNGVSFVKTRLTGKARDVISTEATIADIQTRLRNTIKPETATHLIDKFKGLKLEQSKTEFIKEVENVSNKLRRSFISEGVPIAVADTYTTRHTVEALIKNSPSNKIKIVLESSAFKTSEEATAKFSALVNETPPEHNVSFYRNYQRQGRKPNYYNNYRQNNPRNQDDRNRRPNNRNNNYNNNYQQNNRSNYQNNRNNYQNRNNNSRQTSAMSSENIGGPQQTQQ